MSHVPETEVSVTQLGIVFKNQRNQSVRIESDETSDHQTQNAGRPSKKCESVGKTQ